jgi:hypothetical protein
MFWSEEVMEIIAYILSVRGNSIKFSHANWVGKSRGDPAPDYKDANRFRPDDLEPDILQIAKSEYDPKGGICGQLRQAAFEAKVSKKPVKLFIEDGKITDLRL